MQPDRITRTEYAAELNRLNTRREELEEQESTLVSHDHGGGLPHDEQNRLARVRGELADVLQEIGDLKDRVADGALGD
ncbi:hypothetical protein Ade02nite_53890 [Paractinoplanes deccanensis]|uniref:Uncharacterized protein n=1 Tax=Paractinoplanes deccanensis TaxID=113561 RepID=A0ABQ3Y9R5_9ACTN|nr:hypothetical protein [Actinoplanes deccanensis]GID76748.1 hypothetical protein Ade02nite_53890 [Actinoplanes deccanensis]